MPRALVVGRAARWMALLWLVALTLAGWTIAQLPLAQLGASIRALTLWQWLSWLGLNALILLLLSLRWQLLTRALGERLGLGKLLVIRQAGQTISFITPGPQFGGEPLQVYWLYRAGLPLRTALLSLGLDRFFELWVNFSVLLLAALGLWLIHQSDTASLAASLNTLLPMLMLLGLMALLAWVLVRQPEWLSQRLEQLAQRWHHNPRLQAINQHWQGLGADLRHALHTHPGLFGWAILLSLLGWVGLLAELYWLLHWLGIQAELHQFLVIFIALRMAFLLPMPGGVGTLEAAVLWSFHSLNLPASAALGLIALMRLRDVLILLIGLGCLKLGSRLSTPSN